MSNTEIMFALLALLAILVMVSFIYTSSVSSEVKKQGKKISQLDFSNKLFTSINEPEIPKSRYTMVDEKNLLEKVNDAIKDARAKGHERAATGIEHMKKVAMLYDTKHYYDMLDSYCDYLNKVGKIDYS